MPMATVNWTKTSERPHARPGPKDAVNAEDKRVSLVVTATVEEVLANVDSGCCNDST